jgi:hypothetical protein
LLAVISVFLPWSTAGAGDFSTSMSGWKAGGMDTLFLRVSTLIPVLIILAAVGLVIGITKGKKRLPIIGLVVSAYFLLSSLVAVFQPLSGTEELKISNYGIGVWVFVLAWIIAMVGFALAVVMKSTKTS